MFQIDKVNDNHYVRIDKSYRIKLPVVFHGASMFCSQFNVSLAMQGGVMWITRPDVKFRMPGAVWNHLNAQGIMKLSKELCDALGAVPGEYLLLTIFQSEKRIAIVKKPAGCDICHTTDPSRFTISDLICDRCFEDIKLGSKDQQRREGAHY